MTDTVSTPGQDSLTWDPPAGDIALEDLYPGSGSPTTASASQQAPATTQQPETYVYTYKSRDEAETGIARKDTLIEEQKRRIAELEARLAPAQTAPPAASTPDNRSYLQRVQEAVKRAVEDGDPTEYEKVQREFVFQTLGPAVPIFMENARALAVSQVDEEIPGFKQFLRGPDFAKVKETFPALKVAIEGAESNLDFTGQLPDLYRLAYTTAQGLKLPELVKQAPLAQTLAAPPQATASRPTMTSSTQEPPAFAPPPDMNTADGRKAIIEAMEKKGVQNTPIKW
jgi:hypothetical protein